MVLLECWPIVQEADRKESSDEGTPDGKKGLRGVYHDFLKTCIAELKAKDPEMRGKDALAEARRLSIPQPTINLI